MDRSPGGPSALIVSGVVYTAREAWHNASAQMSTDPKQTLVANVLPFPKFWAWLKQHPNCILSAGTPEAVIYDATEFHWHLGEDDDGAMLVQLLRGKDVVGELAIFPRDVTYVQSEVRGEEEVLFECVSENENEQVASYHFTLTHDYTEPAGKQGKFVH